MAPRAIGAGPPETGFNMYPRHTRANPHIPAETMRRGFVGARQTVHHVTNLPKAPSGLIRAGEVGAGAAVVGGGAVAARKLYRKRKAEPMSKSAFGVEHGIEKAFSNSDKQAAKEGAAAGAAAATIRPLRRKAATNREFANSDYAQARRQAERAPEVARHYKRMGHVFRSFERGQKGAAVAAGVGAVGLGVHAADKALRPRYGNVNKAVFGGVRRAAAMTEHLSSSAHRSAMASQRVDAMKASANLGHVGGAHRAPSRGPRHAVESAKKTHRGTTGLAVGAAAGLGAPTGVRQAKARLTPVSV